MNRLLLIAAVLLAGCSLPVPATPPAPPAPVVAECLDIITIDDFALRTPAQGQFLGDVKYWKGLTQNCHKFWHVDAKQSADYQAQISSAGGLPCVIFADDKTKKVLGTAKLPDGQQGMDALIHKYSGK